MKNANEMAKQELIYEVSTLTMYDAYCKWKQDTIDGLVKVEKIIELANQLAEPKECEIVEDERFYSDNDLDTWYKFNCSVCRHEIATSEEYDTRFIGNYCPNCGGRIIKERST